MMAALRGADPGRFPLDPVRTGERTGPGWVGWESSGVGMVALEAEAGVTPASAEVHLGMGRVWEVLLGGGELASLSCSGECRVWADPAASISLSRVALRLGSDSMSDAVMACASIASSASLRYARTAHSAPWTPACLFLDATHVFQRQSPSSYIVMQPNQLWPGQPGDVQLG